MQSTALQFSLPIFDELRMTAARLRHIAVGMTRTMNVIAAVPALNLLAGVLLIGRKRKFNR